MAKKRFHISGLQEVICGLVIQRKLDATDLKIIEARNYNPMPSMRTVAKLLNIHVANVSRRSQRIKRLILKA